MDNTEEMKNISKEKTKKKKEYMYITIQKSVQKPLSQDTRY